MRCTGELPLGWLQFRRPPVFGHANYMTVCRPEATPLCAYYSRLPLAGWLAGWRRAEESCELRTGNLLWLCVLVGWLVGRSTLSLRYRYFCMPACTYWLLCSALCRAVCYLMVSLFARSPAWPRKPPSADDRRCLCVPVPACVSVSVSVGFSIAQ